MTWPERVEYTLLFIMIIKDLNKMSIRCLAQKDLCVCKLSVSLKLRPFSRSLQ